MIYVESIEYPGLDSIVNDIEIYKNKFIKDSLLVFRNANLSYEEHEIFSRTLGDHFGWYPNTSSEWFSRYEEDHSRHKKLPNSGPDDIILDWHVEHIYFTNPIVSSVWNMIKFTTDSKNGKTYFIDTSKLYKLLNKEEQDFLNSITITAEFPRDNIIKNCKATGQHWLTDDMVIRLPLFDISGSRINDVLESYNNQDPTEENKQFFVNIANKILNEIDNNLDLRIVHEWKKGDLLVTDMYKLAHSVTGGFVPEERFFTGTWGSKYNSDKNML